MSIEEIQNLKITKRVASRIMGQLYDISGVLSQPILIKLKIMFAGICQDVKNNWDITSREELNKQFCEFLVDMKKYFQDPIYIDRCIIGKRQKLAKIHLTSDGSQDAYSFNLYILTIDENGTITPKLCYSNSSISRHNVPQVILSIIMNIVIF